MALIWQNAPMMSLEAGCFDGITRVDELRQFGNLGVGAFEHLHGEMVGVDKEERLSTPWLRSFVFRHPWLQLNLLTAFVAAGVVTSNDNFVGRTAERFRHFRGVTVRRGGRIGANATMAVRTRACGMRRATDSIPTSRRRESTG